jgi:hypothetical protein
METTDTGVNTGEILNGFRADVGKTSYHIASSDDSYIEYTNATNFVYSTPVIGTFDTWNINDTYSSTSSTISCPSRITFKSSIDDGNGYVQMFEQNYTETSLDCEQKNLTQFNYAIDTSLGVSTLSGKTLSFTQRCGASNNSFSIAVAIDASYTVTGTICSIKQQDSTAVNARTETNIVIANGGAVDASNIAGVVRFLPTGYTHAAGQLVFALAKSVDGSRYYFTLSDGGSPGQLAGGLVKATLN